ncbi:MAG: diadenylate cyclase [Candidatus Latescibacterota bacterium]
MLDPLPHITLTNVIDVAAVGLLLWALIAWSRRMHATLAVVGLVLLGLLYLAAQYLQLRMTAWIFQGFFAVLVIVVVVVFQSDLRRLFEQIGVLSLRRRPVPADRTSIAAVYRAVVRMAGARTGALVVIPGREGVERHLQGGMALDALVSEELILSIFDTHSPGHDGAVVLRGDRLDRFAAHLPLSEERARLGPAGTRHAAALGLSERTDALGVVVSEERGTICVARRGELQVLAHPRELLEALREHMAYRGATAEHQAQRRLRWRRRLLEGALALSLAVLCWLVLIPGSDVEERTITAPVVVDNLPPGFALQSVAPGRVRVTLQGRQRDLLLAQAGRVQVVIDAALVKQDRRTFEVTSSNVRHPPNLQVVSLEPERVRLAVQHD